MPSVNSSIMRVEDYDSIPSPQDLVNAYSNGFKGVRIDRASYYSMDRVINRVVHDFKDVYKDARGKAHLPYKVVTIKEPQFGRYESQTTGDCVSHATRNSGMLDYCIDTVFGLTEYSGRFATENIYGHRGHGGQGANCSRLASYVGPNGPGGFLVRKKYGSGRNSVDLSVYNSRTGHNWGRSGTPKWLSEIADDNKALKVYSIKSMDDVITSLSLGYGISFCSSYGFSSKRNEDGVSEQRGSWAHAMAWIGVDDTDWAHQNYGGPLVLIQNSWGPNWNGGPKRHEQPDGSFWIRASVANKMIRNGAGYAIASVRGFNPVLVLDTMGRLQQESKS